MSVSEHKEPVRHVEVFTDAGRRRRRSREAKAAIIAESYGEGETCRRAASRADATVVVRLARRSGSVLPTMFISAVMKTMQLEPPAVGTQR